MNDNLSAHKASDYNNEIGKTIPYYGLFHNATISLIKAVNPNVQTWLDTGCGTGNLIEQALPEFPNCKFLLSDPSAEMLLICKERFQTPQVEIIGQYTSSDIVTDIQPEVITAIQSHHYLNTKGRIESTQHCYNLLEQSGIYVTFENIKPDSIKGIEIGLTRWAEFQKSMGKTDDQVKSHIGRFDKEYFPIKTSEHIEILKKAGFTTVEMFWLSYMQAGFYAVK